MMHSLERFLPCVGPFMEDEHGLPGGGVTAVLTLERLVVAVHCLNMLLQALAVGKRSLARLASLVGEPGLAT